MNNDEVMKIIFYLWVGVGFTLTCRIYVDNLEAMVIKLVGDKYKSEKPQGHKAGRVLLTVLAWPVFAAALLGLWAAVSAKDKK